MSDKCEYCKKDLTFLNAENKSRHNLKHLNSGHTKITSIKPITGYFHKQAGKNATEGIPDASMCTYGAKFNLKSACTSSKKTPCTNRPIRCSVCQCVFWSYNILFHFSLNHSHLSYTDKCHPSDDEISNVKKSNY